MQTRKGYLAYDTFCNAFLAAEGSWSESATNAFIFETEKAIQDEVDERYAKICKDLPSGAKVGFRIFELEFPLN